MGLNVWKGKWLVLKEKLRYSIVQRRRVDAATMALHNFIRLSNLGDIDFDSYYSTGDVLTEDSDLNEDEEHNNTHVHLYERHLLSVTYNNWFIKLNQ